MKTKSMPRAELPALTPSELEEIVQAEISESRLPTHQELRQLAPYVVLPHIRQNGPILGEDVQSLFKDLYRSRGMPANLIDDSQERNNYTRFKNRVAFAVLNNLQRKEGPDAYKRTLIQGHGTKGRRSYSLTAAGSRIAPQYMVEFAIDTGRNEISVGISSNQSKQDAELTALEGPSGEQRHRNHFWRDRTLPERKLRTMADPICEACGEKMPKKYGPIHSWYALDVHHAEPVGNRPAPKHTPIDQTHVLCASCHAVLHRANRESPLTVLALRQLIGSNR